MMKPLKLGLRFWLLITSIFSFLGGWAMLSHAGKPTPFSIFTSPNTEPSTDTLADAQPTSSFAAMPTLQPIPSLDSLISAAGNGATLGSGSFNVQPVQIPSSNLNALAKKPRIHTRGS
jgi:hypothetical protein